MKPQNYFKYAAGAFVIAALSFLAACGNKGGDNNVQPVQPIYGFQGCPTCQIGGAVLFTAESTDYTQVLRMNWSFAGQNTAIAQAYPYNVGAITPGTYYGAVTATGQMNLSQPMTNYYCVIPAGVYSLITTQAGQWGSGIVNNLSMQAIGPASLTMSFMGQVSSPGWLAQGQLSSSTNPIGRMFGDISVISVNGQVCQQNIMVQ